MNGEIDPALIWGLTGNTGVGRFRLRKQVINGGLNRYDEQLSGILEKRVLLGLRSYSHGF